MCVNAILMIPLGLTVPNKNISVNVLCRNNHYHSHLLKGGGPFSVQVKIKFKGFFYKIRGNKKFFR